MSEHAHRVVVHYPRGVTALVWFDLATGRSVRNRRHSSRHGQNVDLASIHRQREGTGSHDRTDRPGKVGVNVPAPTRQLDDQEMVGKPYRRYGITDDAESRIVPTLIRQKR